jgi:hypothetical protein
MIPELHEGSEGLQRSTLLRQLAELDRAEPSPELDRAVLEQARRTVRPGPASGAGHSLRWIAPAAVMLAVAAITTSMLQPGPAAIGRRVAAAPPRQIPTLLPVSAVERAVPATLAPMVPVVPVVPVPVVPVVPETSGSHVSYAIHPLQLRLMGTTAAPPPPKAGWPSLVETDARAREMVVIPRARLESHPEEWLSRIRQLRAEGRTADADRESAAFSKVYSSYPDTRGLVPLVQPHGK